MVGGTLSGGFYPGTDSDIYDIKNKNNLFSNLLLKLLIITYYHYPISKPFMHPIYVLFLIYIMITFVYYNSLRLYIICIYNSLRMYIKRKNSSIMFKFLN